MATESAMRVVESSRGAKWRSSSKDAATYGSPSLAMEEHGLRGHKAVSVPNRSGSAPPSMEGSFAALSIEQKLSANSSLDDVSNTIEYHESEEKLQCNPTYLVYSFANMQLDRHPGPLSSHKEETEDDSPPQVASQDLDESSVATAPMFSSGSRHKSVVDLIQEDFPRTPSPVYIQSRSSHLATTDELADHETNAALFNQPSVDKIKDPNSCYINPKISSLDSQDAELKPSNVLRRQLKDKSIDKYVDLDDSLSENPRIDSRTNVEARKNQERQQSYVKNVPKLRVSVQDDIPIKLQGFQGHTISQGMLHSPGFMPRLYAAESSYVNSGNQLFANLQPSSVYAPQYNLPGYGSGSALFPPSIAGYPSHSLVPLPPSPSYIGITPGISTWEGIPHMGDMQHQTRFYGQHGSVPQPSLSNQVHMQYYMLPSQHVYGSSVQHGQFTSRGMIGSQFAQPESTFRAYMGDQKFGAPIDGGSDISVQRNMKMSGYGNPPFVNVMTHLPASPLASPITSSSPVGGVNYPRHQSEMRFPQGLIMNPEIYRQGKRGVNNADDSNKFSFLEELKAGKAQTLKLSNIEGRIVEFSVDQHGSRFIQQKLENCSVEDKIIVFKEVVPHASRLMVDVFGNYVIQKFFEYGSAEQRRELANKLCGQMVPLSLQMYGCRVIQKALEVIDLGQKTLLVKELDGHVMKCVHDQNGNHVIQKCIETLPTEKIGFILSSFKGHVPELATHPYGCRVIQRVLEYCANDVHCQCILDEILESACFLAQDQYGNYVTQHVLERGKPHEQSRIISKVTGKIVQMSQHKYASNVVEKCLEYASTTERELLIEEILEETEENDNLLAMMKDQYANYVVQKIFETSSDKQRAMLLDRIRLHLQALRKYTYGKHIVARFEQLAGEDFTLLAESCTTEPDVA